MKKLLLLLGALVITGSIVLAQNGAPAYSVVNLNLSPTYPATVNTNLAAPPLIFVGKQHDVAIQITFAHSSASISNVVFHFTPSVDNVTYDASQGFSLTAAATGATPVTLSTNWNSRGWGYLHLDGISNIPAILPLTNVSGIYGVKMSAP